MIGEGLVSPPTAFIQIQKKLIGKSLAEDGILAQVEVAFA